VVSVRPRVPPPGPHGLGPIERPLATELRAHGRPLALPTLTLRLPDLPRRAIRYHVARWVACGLVEAIEVAPGWPAYRWSPTAPPSAFDVLPIGTCPRCGGYARSAWPGGEVPEDEGPEVDP
jgi:hypothetical protein